MQRVPHCSVCEHLRAIGVEGRIRLCGHPAAVQTTNQGYRLDRKIYSDEFGVSPKWCPRREKEIRKED